MPLHQLPLLMMVCDPLPDESTAAALPGCRGVLGAGHSAQAQKYTGHQVINAVRYESDKQSGIGNRPRRVPLPLTCPAPLTCSRRSDDDP